MTGIFNSAHTAWSRMDAFRADRARCKRYVYGEQWDDIITTPEGRMTEREFIQRQGQEPLKNNLLRRVLRNVVGLYRSQYKVPLLSKKNSGMTGQELREANARRLRWYKENRMEELSPRLLEEFLISGIVSVKLEGERILPVTPDNFFFHSNGYDPRGEDIDLIGEVHRVSFGTLIEKFCKSSDDYAKLVSLYGADKRGMDGCCVTEVWHKDIQVMCLSHDEGSSSLRIEPIEELWKGGKGKKADSFKTIVRTGWRCFWFAHNGDLLRVSQTVSRHPYVFKAYPYIDGEIHSYISDIIDQQRYVNRLITLHDLIMRSSAKGVLLFPDESLPAGMDLQDVANEWASFNGVIPYRARPGVAMPTQVSANSTNIGISELLKIELQMLEDISGVSPTLQGKLMTNSTSGTLFSKQNEAAQTSLLDILRSYSDFLANLMDQYSYNAK